jgi:pseudaminic acid biosynthesis-associated methylase
MEKNEQIEFWKGEFGDEYTERNSGEWDNFYKEQWGVTRTELNEEFLKDMDKNLVILEFGCNRANQLLILKKQGFTNLWGLEINKKAAKLARKDTDLNIIEASALDVPFKDNSFDLVFTSGVLIHIAPENLKKIMSEMYRVSKKHIWCFEYFSEKCEEIEYRGNKNRLWKNDFKSEFLKLFPDLKVVKKKIIKYLNSDNEDMMFLLEKS